MGIIVAPSILSADFSNLKEEIGRVEKACADWIHVDVMDGHFVPNITIGAPVVRSIRLNTKLPLDVHLMITDPDRYLRDFAEAGADYITVHVEACVHLQRTLSHIRTLGKKAGVALNPHTPADTLNYVLEDLDLVLVMSVNPGFGGQTFLKPVLPKIAHVKQMLEAAGRANVHISVDGGINPLTASLAIESGADVMVAGQALYGVENMAQAIEQIRQSPTKSHFCNS